MTDLYRSVPFEMRAADTDGDGFTLEGYAAMFDSPTRIDSWEGCFDEQLARGAFKKSLKERTPVLQYDHGRDVRVGSLPIGSFEELREDPEGLYVRARLLDNDVVKPIRQAIDTQAIHGMSFRFQVVKEEWRTADNKLVKPDDVQRLLWSSDPADPASILKRTLKEVKCPELGPVVFPAYTDTSVGVRAQEIAHLLTDPQKRAALAAVLVGTPSEASEDEGSSAEGRAANSADEPAKPLAVAVPSPQTRARALLFDKEFNRGKH